MQNGVDCLFGANEKNRARNRYLNSYQPRQVKFENMNAKCNCNNCSQPIEFPAEMAGQTIECPNCKLETILFIPPPPPKPEEPKNFIPDPKPTPKLEAILPPVSPLPSRPSSTLQTALLFLNLCAMICGVTFIILIWQRQQQSATEKSSWEYSEFEYPNSARGMSITYNDARPHPF